MPDFQLEEQDKIKKDIDHKYRGHINEIILFRLRLIVFIGIFLHLIFVGLDMAAYPSYADTFFKIRIYDGLLAIIVLLASCSPKMKPQSVWLTNIGASIFIVGMCAMVFISDASSSRYYEGANLVFLATSIINPFYITHLAGCFLVWIAFYDLVMIYGHQTHFNILNFIFANYFMGLTALGVVLITKFFKNEHYNAFVRQERLKINEETLAALYCQADKLSKIDTLTATNNRRHFSDMLNKKIQGAEAAKTAFYLVIFDVDHFKELNDTFGHTLGDKALVNVVGAVKKNIRASDFVGRFGGDEFVICLDHPDKEGVLTKLSKIRNDVKGLDLVYNGKPVPVSVSIGAAKFMPGTGMTEEKLMELADFELFNVKNTTRGEISINQ